MKKEMRTKERVSRADLVLEGCAPRSEEGLPIGNGRMGTMLWTSPASLKMQVNRVDVYANGSASNSFPGTHNDYGYTCAYVDIDLAGFGEDVFGDWTKQRLSLYDASAAFDSHGVRLRAYAADQVDALIIDVEDEREIPQPTQIRLKMLRKSVVCSFGHTAASYLHKVGDTAVLEQKFVEDDYYCSSGVAVRVYGSDVRLRVDNENNGDAPILPPTLKTEIGREEETEIRMMFVQPARRYRIVIASAATFDPAQDMTAAAVGEIDRAQRTGWDELWRAHCDWWSAYWERSHVHMAGGDQADMLNIHYLYYEYIMASCSRNSDFAPNFGGLLFSPRGDHRHWGAMQWWNNLNLMYNPLFAAGRFDILQPYLRMYFNMYDAAHTAARQQWGAEGIYIGETTPVFGSEKLPEDIAQELRALMLFEKPWEERSERFKAFALQKNPFEPRWNFLLGANTLSSWKEGRPCYEPTETGAASYVSHFLSTIGYIGYHFWQYGEYTGDRAFMEQKAYPMVKGAADFFVTYPGLVMGSDGRYHVKYTSHEESLWGGTDAQGTLVAIQGVLRAAIRMAKEYQVDEPMLPRWKEVLDLLAPYPTNHTTAYDVMKAASPEEAEVWVPGLADGKAKIHPEHMPHPCAYVEACTVETAQADPHTFAIAENTLAGMLHQFHTDPMAREMLSSEMSPFGRILAAMGHGEEMLACCKAQIIGQTSDDKHGHCFYEENGSKPMYRNRLNAREGVNAISVQRLGNVATALQLGLLQCSGGSSAADAVLRVFPAWDASMDVDFTLYARPCMKVSSAMQAGAITHIQLEAMKAAGIKVRLPWKRTRIVRKHLVNVTSESMVTLRFEAGETIQLLPCEG